ncbi:hypothetical protein Hanom_Chr14g01280991 [Helianthus anomalus]
MARDEWEDYPPGPDILKGTPWYFEGYIKQKSDVCSVICNNKLIVYTYTNTSIFHLQNYFYGLY